MSKTHQEHLAHIVNITENLDMEQANRVRTAFIKDFVGKGTSFLIGRLASMFKLTMIGSSIGFRFTGNPHGFTKYLLKSFLEKKFGPVTIRTYKNLLEIVMTLDFTNSPEVREHIKQDLETFKKNNGEKE